MSASVIATIAVIAFLIVFIVIGFCRGFLRIILTTFSLIITLVLVGVITPPVADYIENGTVMGPRLQTRIETYVNDKLGGISGSAAAAENKFIDSLPITKSMKADLKSGNTLADYVDNGVSNFAEYIGLKLSSLIIRILCYVLLFILIFLVIRLILRISNLINHIPVLGGINRILGAVIGFAEGVIFLWIICMIIMLMSGTELGISCQQTIAGSTVLTYIYEHNYLMDIVNSVLGLFNIKIDNSITAV